MNNLVLIFGFFLAIPFIAGLPIEKRQVPEGVIIFNLFSKIIKFVNFLN